jgi:signal transduction histidine kinase
MIHGHQDDASRVQMNPREDQPSRAIPLASRAESLQKHIFNMGWLSTSIVHDLKNPLGTVSAGAEMLMELDLAPTEVKRLAANIRRAAGRMRELLADLAGASNGSKSTFQICNIRHVIDAVSEAVRPIAERQGVRIVNEASIGLQIPLVRSRMERVFLNLIANALEAMPHGGEIRIGARQRDNGVLIEVEDTGPGIPRAIQDRLFEPFVTAGKVDGLGLGLALSRQTVLDHGGDMWIEPAAGAHFTIRLPLNRDAEVV